MAITAAVAAPRLLPSYPGNSAAATILTDNQHQHVGIQTMTLNRAFPEIAKRNSHHTPHGVASPRRRHREYLPFPAARLRSAENLSSFTVLQGSLTGSKQTRGASSLMSGAHSSDNLQLPVTTTIAADKMVFPKYEDHLATLPLSAEIRALRRIQSTELVADDQCLPSSSRTFTVPRGRPRHYHYTNNDGSRRNYSSQDDLHNNSNSNSMNTFPNGGLYRASSSSHVQVKSEIISLTDDAAAASTRILTQ